MKRYSSTLFLIILALIFAWISILWWKGKFSNQFQVEGFSQDKSYSLSSGQDIYDDFYADIFDDLTLAHSRANYTWDAFCKAVQPFSGARFLDIGSGTGSLVHIIRKDGFDCIGIDSSRHMIQSSDSSSHFINKNFLDPMTFNSGDFFGAFCLGMTIYELCESDKLQLFKNTFFWLRPGGYFMIHLVDVSNFSPVVPLIASYSNSEEPVFSANVDFNGFSYKYDFDIDSSDSSDSNSKCGCSSKPILATQTETFTDITTGNIRENAIQLFLSSESNIVKMIESVGFSSVGKWNLRDSVYRDSFQYFYLFTR